MMIETLRAYSESLDALRQGVPADEARRLADVTPALAARAFAEAADKIESLMAERDAALKQGRFLWGALSANQRLQLNRYLSDDELVALSHSSPTEGGEA